MRSIGADPTRYSGHSLRAGCVTAAHISGANVDDIMLKTGHTQVEMVRRSAVSMLDIVDTAQRNLGGTVQLKIRKVV